MVSVCSRHGVTHVIEGPRPPRGLAFPYAVLRDAWFAWPVRVHGRELPGAPTSAHLAREFAKWLVHDFPRLDDLVLVISELVSNAIDHSRSSDPGGTFAMRLAVLSDGSVCVVVWDAGNDRDTDPRSREADEDDQHGRGLMIVNALCARARRLRDGDCHGVLVVITPKERGDS